MIRVVPLTLDLVPEVHHIHTEFVSSKKLCFCLPINDTESELFELYSKDPDRLQLAAVAVNADGAAVGFVHMTTRGVSRGCFEECLHPNQAGEYYIETMAVSAGQRGRGTGQKMLEWCEATARERGGTKLTLGVINGNPARRLYERFGFIPQPTTSCNTCCTTVILLFVFGQPYGWCPPAFGGTIMEKSL